MSKSKSMRLVDMTSTQLFKLQASNIFEKLRQEIKDTDIEFKPTHLGGLPGQRDILSSDNVMRETTVVN